MDEDLTGSTEGEEMRREKVKTMATEDEDDSESMK